MFDAVSIRKRIAEVATTEAGLAPGEAQDVALHLTDWLGDLLNFTEFCKNPGAFTLREADELLLAFLQHAPNHMAAAAKLYADAPVSDLFGVGAVQAHSDDDA